SSASDRVLPALKLLKKELGEANQQGQVVIRYPLTTIELAEISATTRETAGLVLQQLRKDGVIVRLHRQITFLKA
ncbi:MAG: helix-turn-helix domain-containing protein, partial [Lactobacillus sp.]|nr:helix-turn-helix domain-containing protein [Lactobacillus sp.]